MSPLTVHVVIPAHNEHALVGPAVTAARVACARAEDEVDVRTTCTVVADACTDGTARTARAAGAEVLAVHLRNVGAARRAGIYRARRRIPSRARDTWIACTDADSVVPPDWLLAHLQHRRAGADLVLGSVRPRAEDLPIALMDAWRAQHRPGAAEHAVYGANMSFGAAAYDTVGGFAPLVAHEDRTLLEAFLRHGMRVQDDATIEVQTSGRLAGRAPEGFAAYLHHLGQRVMSTNSITPASKAGDERLVVDRDCEHVTVGTDCPACPVCLDT